MEALETEFKPLGIVAYSNCCRYGCSGAYNEDDPNFEGRDSTECFWLLYRCMSVCMVCFDPVPNAIVVIWSSRPRVFGARLQHTS